MKQHVTAVGILHIGLSILVLLIATIVVASMMLPGFIVVGIEGETLPLAILTTIGCGIGAFMAVLSLPGIIGGIGLLKMQSWARYLVLILGVIQLVNIPIGTAVGIYTIWALIQDETAELFSAGEEATSEVAEAEPEVAEAEAEVIEAEPEGVEAEPEEAET